MGESNPAPAGNAKTLDFALDLAQGRKLPLPFLGQRD